MTTHADQKFQAEEDGGGTDRGGGGGMFDGDDWLTLFGGGRTPATAIGSVAYEESEERARQFKGTFNLKAEEVLADSGAMHLFRVVLLAMRLLPAP
jgi:hypothetical protein